MSQQAIKAKIAIGNHSALRVRRADRERIRSFYRDVLGCSVTRELDDKDDVRIGDDFYIAFLYGRGDGGDVTKGVTYAAAEVLDDDDFFKAIFLELKTDNVEEMRQRIVAFGVRVLDTPDPHLYFQAPGGQVFRLVGTHEDLSRYEGNGRQRSIAEPRPAARAVTDGEIVLASVDIAAPPERVWRALMTDECERWWGAPSVYAIESWNADVRAGGKWSLVIRLPDGTGLPASGEFIEATPSKIVQTRRYDWDHPTLGRHVTKVATQLAAIDGGTHVTVRHEDFGAGENAHAAAVEHAGGWERLLVWLAAYLTPRSDQGS
jgi:uncharacterized protein YndB with AHSA1/START domain